MRDEVLVLVNIPSSHFLLSLTHSAKQQLSYVVACHPMSRDVGATFDVCVHAFCSIQRCRFFRPDIWRNKNGLPSTFIPPFRTWNWTINHNAAARPRPRSRQLLFWSQSQKRGDKAWSWGASQVVEPRPARFFTAPSFTSQVMAATTCAKLAENTFLQVFLHKVLFVNLLPGMFLIDLLHQKLSNMFLHWPHLRLWQLRSLSAW